MNEVARGLKYLSDGVGIIGEEKCVRQQFPPGIGRSHRINAILRALGQQIERSQRRRGILADFRQFSGEWSAVGDIASVMLADVGDLIGEKRGISWREARDSCFTRARDSRKQKSFAVANRAGGVQKESALRREDDGMYDSENSVDGVGIRSLANAAAVRRRVPLGAEVASLQ